MSVFKQSSPSAWPMGGTHNVLGPLCKSFPEFPHFPHSEFPVSHFAVLSAMPIASLSLVVEGPSPLARHGAIAVPLGEKSPHESLKVRGSGMEGACSPKGANCPEGLPGRK